VLCGGTPIPGKGEGDPPGSTDPAALEEELNILLGEPGPETRGPKTPGREKAEEETGGNPGAAEDS